MTAVHAISAPLSLTGRENLVCYHASSMERYFPVGPGIEVCIEPYEDLKWEAEMDQEPSVYNGRGRMNHREKKGLAIDTLL